MDLGYAVYTRVERLRRFHHTSENIEHAWSRYDFGI
jgi:hypothetical protein